MTSYTPGPWTLNGEVRRVGDTEHYCADICGPADGGFWRGGVAYIQTADHLKHGMRIDEGKANAALIAAAPELVDALKRLMPDNLGSLPATMPDSATLPLDVTFGELRQAMAALAKAEGRQS